VRICTGVRVTGLRLEDGAVSAVGTDQGTVRCEHLVVGVRPWIRDVWKMLDLPQKITVKAPDGELYHDRGMWTY
jgi:glycine/D-amino acid oxidase-like deaminating enzyme